MGKKRNRKNNAKNKVVFAENTEIKAEVPELAVEAEMPEPVVEAETFEPAAETELFGAVTETGSPEPLWDTVVLDPAEQAEMLYPAEQAEQLDQVAEAEVQEKLDEIKDTAETDDTVIADAEEPAFDHVISEEADIRDDALFADEPEAAFPMDSIEMSAADVQENDHAAAGQSAVKSAAAAAGSTISKAASRIRAINVKQYFGNKPVTRKFVTIALVGVVLLNAALTAGLLAVFSGNNDEDSSYDYLNEYPDYDYYFDYDSQDPGDGKAPQGDQYDDWYNDDYDGWYNDGGNSWYNDGDNGWYDGGDYDLEYDYGQEWNQEGNSSIGIEEELS